MLTYLEANIYRDFLELTFYCVILKLSNKELASLSDVARLLGARLSVPAGLVPGSGAQGQERVGSGRAGSGLGSLHVGSVLAE